MKKLKKHKVIGSTGGGCHILIDWDDGGGDSGWDTNVSWAWCGGCPC